jgi:membrane protein DedA with SNARE-associated domain
MKGTIQFLIDHGHVLVFLSVLADQVGLPLPAFPVLLAAGALSRSGELSLTVTMLLAVMASVAGHLVWFEAGRRRGNQVLELLCRISIEPDACVRKTENMFVRYGAKALIMAHFVPGLGTVAQPLAGMSGMSVARFIGLEVVGSLLWAGAICATGYGLANQLEDVAEIAASWGTSLLFVLGGLLGAYLMFKYAQRHLLLRSLRMPRIAPDELLRLMDTSEPPAIVDVRHDRDLERDPELIRGALTIPFEHMELRHKELPTDREIILYCS